MHPVERRALLEGLREAVLAVDRSRTVTYANPAASELLARPVASLPGLALGALFPERTRAALDALPGDVLRVPVLRADGLEVLVDLLASPVDDGMVLTLRRIAHSAESGEEPATAPAQSYRQVFEHAPIGILHFDRHGVITACNDRFVRIIGSTRGALIGLDMCTLADPGVRRTVAVALAGHPGHYEGDYRSMTAEKVTPVRAQFVPIFDAEGEVAGGVGIVEDVTERRAAERALAQAERMAALGTLAAGVAHEINNPLAYAIASLEQARRHLDPHDHPELGELLQRAAEGTERVATIMNDLRTFSRAEETPRRPIDLQQALEAAANLAGREIRQRARLERRYEPVPPVLGAENRLVQVFVNLLVNAAQAIPPGDPERHRVAVVTRTDPTGSAVAEIEDSGAGIAPADLPHLFEPFFTTKSGGTGLGLAICHGIVTGMGGRIEAKGRSGGGTIFRVVLPATPPGAGDAPTPRPPPPRAPRPPRLLIVDDEERLGETLQIALTPGYDVSYVSTGAEAIARLEADQDVDVVLCDLAMPGMSGQEVYERVATRYPDLAARFVFMTGGAFDDATRAFLRRVERPRIDKPFRIATLEQVLARWTGPG